MADILGDNPIEYYSSGTSKRYELSGAFRRIQESMALDAIDIGSFKKGAKVLDLGCGTGFSMNALKSKGLKAFGVDISIEMLKFAKNKGFNVALADMKSLPIKDESFDNLISISAIQWEKPKDYSIVLEEIKRVIKDSAVVQFYPKEKAELEYFIKLAKKYFLMEVYIVGQGVKEKIYIKLKKAK
jgi:ubiquinone/menaquinone biosynthesis C-methylase UbiE